MSETTEQALVAMLTKIVNRASRARKAGSTEIMLQEVPAALLEQAGELLAQIARQRTFDEANQRHPLPIRGERA